MFCPNCGSQLPDNAEFCGVCGTRLGGGASAAQPAPQPAPMQGFQAAGQPIAQPAFSSQAAAFSPAPAFEGASASASPLGLGKRTLAMLGGSILTLILMFQAWFEFPVIGKITDFAASMGSMSSVEASIIPSLKVVINSAFNMPEVLGLSDALHKIASALNMQLSQSSSSFDASSLTQFQQVQSAVGSIDLAGTIMMVMFVVWLVCVVGIVAGLVLKVVKNNDVVLFFALAASGVLALACVVAAFVLNGNAEAGLDSLTQLNPSIAAAVSGFKPVLAPTIPAILTVTVAVGSAVGSRFLKD